MKLEKRLEGLAEAEAIDYLRSRISALRADMATFGATEEDRSRLAELNAALQKLS